MNCYERLSDGHSKDFAEKKFYQIYTHHIKGWIAQNAEHDRQFFGQVLTETSNI